jgi:hypothetical protein
VVHAFRYGLRNPGFSLLDKSKNRNLIERMPLLPPTLGCKVKVKISLLEAMEAHRVARG